MHDNNENNQSFSGHNTLFQSESPKLLPLSNKFYADTLEKVFSEFHINNYEIDWSKITIILDAVDRKDFSELASNAAMFVPAGSITPGEDEENTPRYPEIFDRAMTMFGWERPQHILWISKDVCESAELIFAFYLAHELQHAVQFFTDSAMFKVNYLLVKYGTQWRLKEYIEIPYEYECDWIAKRITSKVLYVHNLDEELKEIAGKGDRFRIRNIENIDINKNYSMKNETYKLIKKLLPQEIEELKEIIDHESCDDDFRDKCLLVIHQAFEREINIQD